MGLATCSLALASPPAAPVLSSPAPDDPQSRWRADGYHGWAPDFTDGYWLSVPNDAALALVDRLSVSAWVSVSYPGESSYMRILSTKSTPEAAAGYELEYNLTTGTLDLLGGGSDYARAEKVYLGDGAWHHIVATADGTRAHLYVDGVDRTTDGTIGRSRSDGTRFEIGRRTGTLFTWWHRSIDDLRLFDDALSPSEVRALAGAAVSATGNDHQSDSNGPTGNG